MKSTRELIRKEFSTKCNMSRFFACCERQKMIRFRDLNRNETYALVIFNELGQINEKQKLILGKML